MYTVSDERPAGQHPPQHELGHRQHGTRESAHYGNAVEEVVLREDREEDACSTGCGHNETGRGQEGKHWAAPTLSLRQDEPPDRPQLDRQ